MLAALTEAQRQQLVSFARKRVNRLATTPWAQRLLAITSPEDIVAEAYEKLLCGESRVQEGRVLKPEDLLDAKAFIRGVQGIIQSDISNWITLAEGTFPHEAVDETDPDSNSMRLSDPADSPRILARRDLRQALFIRLRQKTQAEPQLLSVIEDWEPRFLEADRIAGPEFDKNLVQRVRRLARKVLWELATEAEPHAVDGRDMLL